MPGKLRYNEGTLEALSPPSRQRVFTDFSQTVILEEVSREIWIQGPGDVQLQGASDDAMGEVFTVENFTEDSIFVTAKLIYAIGTGTTVAKIIVWD